MRAIIAEGLADSAHDVSDGGLAVTMAECCTKQTGARITITHTEHPEFELFGEAQSRIVLTTHNLSRVEQIAAHYGVAAPAIGFTMNTRLQIGDGHQMLIDLTTADLKQSTESALPELLHEANVR